VVRINNQQIEFYSIPEWAKYIAMDDDGKWWAFHHRPILSKDGREWLPVDGEPEQVYPVLPTTLKEVNR